MSALKSFSFLPYLSLEPHYIFLYLTQPKSLKDMVHTWAAITSVFILVPWIWGGREFQMIIHLTLNVDSTFKCMPAQKSGCGVHVCADMSDHFALLPHIFGRCWKCMGKKIIAERESPASEFYVPVFQRREFLVFFFFFCPFGKIIPIRVKFSGFLLCVTGIFRNKKKVSIISQYT